MSSISSYHNVSHKKVNGALTLTHAALAFQPASNPSANMTFSWSVISKHQVSPATHAKAMLKIVFSDGNKPATFQFSSRSDLEKIRKDISDRLMKFRGSSNGTAQSPIAIHSPQSQSLSGRKRAPSFSSAGMSPSKRVAPGATTSTSFGELDATALAVTRASLLAANPTLRSQHNYLVEETKTVEEDDFWKTHKDLLEEEYARISGVRVTGTSSLLQSHLQLLTGKVTLGVEEMRQIFILYPAVHRAYEEKVPLELSDEQFWRKYLESEYFHRDRGRLGAASRNSASGPPGQKANAKKKGPTVEEQEARAAAVGTDDLFSRYDQKLKEQMQQAQNGNRKWGTNLAVGQFDLASTYETERGNLLEGPKDNHPSNPGDDSKGSRVIQKYNRHWAMVLHPEEAVAGSDLSEVAKKSVSEVIPGDKDAKAHGGVTEDMQKLVGFAMASSEQANHALGKGVSNDDDYAELTLQNIEVYYSGRPERTSQNKGNDEATLKRNSLFATSMLAKISTIANSIRDGGGNHQSLLKEAFPAPLLGQQLLSALTKKMAQDSKTDADALEVVNSLPDDFKKRLHSYFRRSSELLRHFYGLRRLADSQGGNAHAQKLKRIVQGMETVYREMEGMRKELEQTEAGETMRKMCLQIMDQLDWAFKLHREGSGGGGGGGFVTIEEF